LFYICADMERIKKFEEEISKRFEVRIDEHPKKFLGFEISDIDDGLKLTQTEKIETKALGKKLFVKFRDVLIKD
jgi:hypothetical protein